VLQMPALFEKVIFFHSKTYIFIEKKFSEIQMGLNNLIVCMLLKINLKLFNSPVKNLCKFQTKLRNLYYMGSYIKQKY